MTTLSAAIDGHLSTFLRMSKRRVYQLSFIKCLSFLLQRQAIGAIQRLGHSSHLGFAELANAMLRRCYTTPWAFFSPWLRRACECHAAALLYNALGQHGFSNLHESGNVGTLDIVDVVTVLAVLHTLGMNAGHNLMQHLVYFCASP